MPVVKSSGVKMRDVNDYTNLSIIIVNNKKQFDFLFQIFTQKVGNVRYEKFFSISFFVQKELRTQPPHPTAQSIEYAAGSQFD